MRIFLILGLGIGIAGCAAIEESLVSNSTALPTTTYSCVLYGKYDDLASCNTSTLAQCEASWQSFPNGGLQPCYSPVAGGEICATLTPAPEWIYSEPDDPDPIGNPQGTYCRIDDSVTLFHRLRSLVGCSSDICICQDSIALYDVGLVISIGGPIAGVMDNNTLCCPGLGPSSSPPCN